MKRVTLLSSVAALIIGITVGALLAQQAQQPRPFFAGNRLGLPVEPAAAGAFEPISSNVKVYGSIYSAERCSYDAGRGVIEQRPEWRRLAHPRRQARRAHRPQHSERGIDVP